MYQVLREPTSTFVSLRGCRYHLLKWGQPSASLPPLVLAHGWMDVAASWQFMVDAFGADFMQDRQIIALDWRGYGQTESPATDSYWFPDYLGDLDALLDIVSPGQAIDLVGHSMGGNVVMMYTGARPERVRRLVNLEGFGLPERPADHAPTQYAKWLDELNVPQDLRPYDSAEGVARRLMKNNPRLSADKAAWLAPHWSQQDEKGRWQILGDPAHKRVNPVMYRVAEVLATWKRIAAPVLSVVGRETDLAQWWGTRYTLEQFDQRLEAVPNVHRQWVDGAGHMLHHDQPQRLAAVIESFLD